MAVKNMESNRTTFVLPNYIWEAFDEYAKQFSNRSAALADILDHVDEPVLNYRLRSTMRHFRLPIKYKMQLAKYNSENGTGNMNLTLREILLQRFSSEMKNNEQLKTTTINDSND